MSGAETWAKAAGMMAYATAAYAMKEEPTKEELASELDAAKRSHQHATRALTNMAVALSDAMDHCVAHEEAARKKKLEHEARVAGLVRETKRLDEELMAARKQTDALEKRLVAEGKRLAEELVAERARADEAVTRLSDWVAGRRKDPLPVVHLSNTEADTVPPEWCVGAREKDADGKRDVIGLFHDEAAARWFAERWRP